MPLLLPLYFIVSNIAYLKASLFSFLAKSVNHPNPLYPGYFMILAITLSSLISPAEKFFSFLISLINLGRNPIILWLNIVLSSPFLKEDSIRSSLTLLIFLAATLEALFSDSIGSFPLAVE